MGIEVTPKAVGTVLEEVTPNDTETGKKIKDAPDTSKIPNTDSNVNVVTESEADTYLKSSDVLENTSKPLDTKQQEAVWNGIKIEAGVEKEKALAKDLKDNPTSGDGKTYKDKKDQEIKGFRADTSSDKNGKVVDPSGRLKEIDKSRGKIHAQIRELKSKDKLTTEEKKTLALLNDQRDKADSISKTIVTTNGASTRINNASAIYEIGRGKKQDLGKNYQDIPGYTDTEAAYEAYKAQYKSSTGKDFELKDNQSLVMYRRGDILAYRLIQSDLIDDTNGSGKQRVTGISDEFSFHIHDMNGTPDDRSDDKVSIQIPKKNPQESNIKDQGINQFKPLPGFDKNNLGDQKPELGFVFYSQAESDTADVQDSSKKTSRVVIDIDAFNDSKFQSLNFWLAFFLDKDKDGTVDTDKDKDGDGIPNEIDPNPGT